MPYTPPINTAANATWVDAPAYTAPAGDAASATWAPPEVIVPPIPTQWLLEVSAPTAITGGKVAATTDGEVFSVFYDSTNAQFIIKVDEAGNEVWRKKITTTLSTYTPVSISSGGGYVALAAAGGSATDIALLDDVDGNIVWATRIPFPVPTYSGTGLSSVLVSPSGDVFAAVGGASGDNTKHRVVKLAAADGAIAWWSDLHDTGSTSFSAKLGIHLLPGGDLVASSRAKFSGLTWPVVHRVSGLTGTVTWTRKILPAGGSNTVSTFAAATDSAGNIYALGATYSDALEDMVLSVVKLDADGGLLWSVDVQTGRIAGPDLSSNVIASADGVYFGVDDWRNPKSNLWFVSASGDEASAAEFGNPVNAFINYDGFSGLALSADTLFMIGDHQVASVYRGLLYRQGLSDFAPATYGDYTRTPIEVTPVANAAIITTETLAFPAAPTDVASAAGLTLTTYSPTLALALHDGPREPEPEPEHAGAEIIAPAGTVEAWLGMQAAAITAPAGVLEAWTGMQIRPITAPVGTLLAYAHDSTGENALHIIAPAGIVSARLGIQARIIGVAGAVTTTATATSMAGLHITAPAGVVTFSATAAVLANATITAPAGTASARLGIRATIAGVVGTVAASAAADNIARATVVAPAGEILFTASVPNRCSLHIVAPAGMMGASIRAHITAPAGMLVITASQEVIAAFEAYSINLGHTPRGPGAQVFDEVTRYTNFPFRQIVRFLGDYYGVADDGLYRLGGATDDGEPIPYALKTCVDDFKAPELKTVAAAYLSGRIGPDTTITLTAGETADESYAHTTPRGQAAQNHREKFGRGVKSRYFSLSLAGEDTLELDGIELEINKLTRRI